MNIIKMILVFWNHVKANDSKCAKSYWRATVQFWNHVKANDSKWSKADYMVSARWQKKTEKADQ